MNDFYEDDEPVEDVVAAFENGAKGVTRNPVASGPHGWSCPHMAITSGGGIISDPVFGCGCRPEPISQTAA